jgi:hypothetical protein
VTVFGYCSSISAKADVRTDLTNTLERDRLYVVRRVVEVKNEPLTAVSVEKVDTRDTGVNEIPLSIGIVLVSVFQSA